MITKTAGGFLAAGKGNAAGGGTQAVIWTSRNGLTWQRMTAPSLGLAEAGEAVQSISYATYRGHDTLIAGTVGCGRSHLLRRMAEHGRRVGVDPGEHTGQ